MNALIYAQSGGGKTCNATLVKTGKRGKNLLLCSDNSHVVLKNFERPELDIEIVEHWMDTDSNGRAQTHFNAQFEKAVESQKYDNIIVDSLSDIFDLAILELEDSGRYRDMRQAYQLVYQNLKRLARIAGQVDTNVIFTAWHDMTEITLPTGEKAIRISPKLPPKILDNVLGLCNIVAYIRTAEKNGEKRWYYHLVGSETLYAKDQLACRPSCLPEDIFTVTNKNK